MRQNICDVNVSPPTSARLPKLLSISASARSTVGRENDDAPKGPTRPRCASGSEENVARVAISMSDVLVVVPGKERLLGRLVVEVREQGSAAWREEKGLKGLLGT